MEEDFDGRLARRQHQQRLVHGIGNLGMEQKRWENDGKRMVEVVMSGFMS